MTWLAKGYQLPQGSGEQPIIDSLNHDSWEGFLRLGVSFWGSYIEDPLLWETTMDF